MLFPGENGSKAAIQSVLGIETLYWPADESLWLCDTGQNIEFQLLDIRQIMLNALLHIN